MKTRFQTEATKIWRVPKFNDLELLHGQHLTQSFPPHTHEHYAFGVLEQGALGYFYRGENLVASRGNINLCIPGEVHTGQPAVPEGWSYRMFYVNAALLQNIASEIADRTHEIPFFQSGVIVDEALAQQLRLAHLQLEQTASPSLDQETVLLAVLANMIRRYADDAPRVRRLGQEPRAIELVKHYLERHYAEDVSLDDLSRFVQLNRYYLVRAFHQSVGIAPHAYLRQVRVKHAKRMLLAGRGIADVAIASGFADQSHLTRWLKRLWGITPGQYRNCVQDHWI